jgi:transcription antitermination protein NusB
MKRRDAREYALQFIYGIDMVAAGKTGGVRQDFSGELDEFWKGAQEQDAGIKTFAGKLAGTTLINLEEIDRIIQNAAQKWKLVRIAAIDRNIMRIAVCELLYMDDIPDAVSINEALEIAKKFSTAESAAFINGILDRISKDKAGKK